MAATARALQISIWHISRKSRLPGTKGGYARGGGGSGAGVDGLPQQRERRQSCIFAIACASETTNLE